MAELLNRTFQREILEFASDYYPRPAPLSGMPTVEPKVLQVNVAYLDEHGLIQAMHPGANKRAVPHGVLITAKGIDFLADDGGLSAILGVVTVKLHEDTIKALIESKIRDSDLPEPEKQRFLDSLRELPGEATKHLVLKLVDAGLENWQKAVPLLMNILN